MSGWPMAGDLGWPLMGDREWCAACLRERQLHPELYESRENVPAVVEKLRRQLATYDSQA